MRGPGVRGRLRGIGRESGEAGGGQQGGGEVARARAGERRAHAVPLSGRKTTEGGSSGGLGQREELGRLQVSGPGGLQVMFPSLSLFFLFYFCFLFF